MSKKLALSGDSPSFMPSNTDPVPPAAKKSSIPSQAASAAPFTPRGAGSSTPAPSENDRPINMANIAAIKEFTPQNSYDLGSSNNPTSTPAPDHNSSYDLFTAGMPSVNPYETEHLNSMTASAFYHNSGAYSSPLQPPAYHLYANIGPHREDLQPHQRQMRDFFMSDDLREELQKKSHAARQVLPNSFQMDNYHSLVPLDKVDPPSRRSVFGQTNSLFKATSARDGHTYCLRRFHAFHALDKEEAKTLSALISKWKQFTNSSIVHVQEIFNTRNFGDRSLVLAQDYFPLAQTLVELHLTQITPPPRFHGLRGGPIPLPTISEDVIWSYVVQIANALRAIHAQNLAARCLDPSKIIVTGKNRIRLTGCAILDIISHKEQKSLAELQDGDFQQLARLILCLGTGKHPNQLADPDADLAILARRYTSGELRDLVRWLQSAPDKTAATLIVRIAPHMIETLERSQQYTDTLTSELYRELENGRIARLLMKLGMVNERGEYDNDPAWSELGDRYALKLFRDYVFHRVDEHGLPVFDMGHMLNCLNKLDAGSTDMIRLASREHETEIIASYAELKLMFNSAFAELMRHNRRP